MRHRDSRPEVIDVQETGPEWAQGCDKCKGGLIGAPDASCFSAPLYLVRVFQASTIC
jgi:hypothetical protein